MPDNLTVARQYLAAVASLESFGAVAGFYTDDVVIEEFPNRIAPQGRVRRAADLQEPYEQARALLRSQNYHVRSALECRNEVVLELEWTGVLAVPVMNMPAGTEMKAFVAMFLTFREGRIASQRNYDCYPPFPTAS